jgi:hypothetical protein
MAEVYPPIACGRKPAARAWPFRSEMAPAYLAIYLDGRSELLIRHKMHRAILPLLLTMGVRMFASPGQAWISKPNGSGHALFCTGFRLCCTKAICLARVFLDRNMDKPLIINKTTIWHTVCLTMLEHAYRKASLLRQSPPTCGLSGGRPFFGRKYMDRTCAS